MDFLNRLCGTCGKRYGAHYGEQCPHPTIPNRRNESNMKFKEKELNLKEEK